MTSYSVGKLFAVASLTIAGCAPARLTPPPPPPPTEGQSSFVLPECDLGNRIFGEPAKSRVVRTFEITLPKKLDIDSHGRNVKQRDGGIDASDTTTYELDAGFEDHKPASQEPYDLYIKDILNRSDFALVRIVATKNSKLKIGFVTDSQKNPVPGKIQGVAAASLTNAESRVLCSNFILSGKEGSNQTKQVARFYIDLAAFKRAAPNYKDTVKFNIWVKLRDESSTMIIIDPAVRNEG